MKLTKLRPLAAILLACTLTACSPAAPSDGPAQSGGSASSATDSQAVTFTDDLGRTVTVARPQRVAALIGSFADIWCLAGGQSTLAATANDAWTSFDLGLSDSVLNLGGVKEPNLELLLSAQPDLVLASCNTTANVDLLPTLEQAGIPVAYFDIQHFSDYLRMLEICTQLTGCPERYTQYGEEVGREAWGYIEYEQPIDPQAAADYFLVADGVGCTGCVHEAASRDMDCCWNCSRNPRRKPRDLYRHRRSGGK